MPDFAAQLAETFKQGTQKITSTSMSNGIPAIGGGQIEMDENFGAGMPNAATPGNLALRIQGGQTKFYHGQRFLKNGTIIMNPSPSDPEIEAINGVKQYNPKIADDSPEAIKNKTAKLEQTVDKLQATIAGMMAGKKPEPQPAEDYSALSWAKLRQVAADRGIDFKAMKRPEIEKALVNGDTEA